MNVRAAFGVNMKNQAWVLGLFDTGVQAGRSLARMGIPVIGVDSDPKMPGTRSRFIQAKIACSPLEQPETFAAWLINEGRQLASPAVLLPTTDAFTLLISRYREILAPYFRFALPAPEIVEALLDKALHARLAQQYGELSPLTYEVNGMGDVASLACQIEYPVFIKARFAHSWRQHFTHKGFVARDEKEFLERIGQVLVIGEGIVVQQIISGRPECHFEVNFYRSVQGDGEILALMGVRKLRQYPSGFGIGTLVETYHEPEVITRTLDFVRAIDFRGVGNIEYKKDEKTGKYYLIELNPRLWQQNSQADVCGINFPFIVYRDLLGIAPSPCVEFPDGVKWLDPMADFQAFLDCRRRGELGVSSWLRSWRGARAFSLLARSDPLPLLHDIEYGLKLLKLPLYLLKSAGRQERKEPGV